MGQCPFQSQSRKEPEEGGDISRRDFLRLGIVGVAAVALATTPLAPLVAEAAPDRPWVDHPFTGDRWEQCHDLRDGKKFARGGRTEEVDVVVIGGGISGLMAAVKLARRHKVLVLEKEHTAGGNSRFGTWNGMRFPIGALYYTKPSTEITAFLKTIGMKPVPVPGSADTLLTKGKYVPHLFSKEIDHAPWPADDRRAFLRAWAHFAAYNEGDRYPDVPVPKNGNQKTLALDHITFLQYCQDHKLGEHVTTFLDQYVRSCWGVGSEKVSAYAAINFLASEFESVYAFPGGNGAISYQLAKLLGDRLRTGCFVDHVTQEKGAVLVDYVDAGPHRIKARQAIMATPKQITKKMISGMPGALADAMAKSRYGSYLVGAICLNQPLSDRAFDLWVENRWYSDLCMGDWMSSNGKPAASRRTVMVASIPMGEIEGRTSLLTTPYEDYRTKLVAELEKDFPGVSSKIAGIQFARFGHPMVVPYPGYLTGVIPAFRKPWGNIWFANADTDGMACFESAFSAAMKAADGVHRALAGRHASALGAGA